MTNIDKLIEQIDILSTHRESSAVLDTLKFCKTELLKAKKYREALDNAWELSTYAACINWRGGSNEKEWLDDLKVLIEKFQHEYKALKQEGE